MTTGGREFLQQATHAELLQSVAAYSPAPPTASLLDAIVVPTARPSPNLETAITLAVDVGCHLVLLCSRDASAEDSAALLQTMGVGQDRATVAGVPGDYDHGLFRFETSAWVQDSRLPARAARDSDLSVKRNIGLALSRMLGWRRIFFMDDDIRDVSADTLGALVSLLGRSGPGGPYRTAGMTVQEFPDNSVVCHARRDVKKDQDVFVSGSVLAVDCAASFGFFPDIYNEDWLFFYDDARGKLLATSGFHARQEPYDPFEDPQRAARQEFGDIIAEGLYSLLHHGTGWESATKKFWQQFIEDRMRILDEIISRSHFVSGRERAEMADAIVAARKTIIDVRPAMCVEYVRAWRADLEGWKTRMKNISRQASVVDALRQLELSPNDSEL